MIVDRVCVAETKKNFFFWLIESVTCAVEEIKDQVGLAFKLAANNFVCLKLNILISQKYFGNFTWRLFALPHPPKYQNSFFKVVPQPELTVAPSPYSKAKSSLTLPEQRINVFR